MSEFISFKNAVKNQIQLMSTGELFSVDVSNDLIWNVYLDAFPEGTNPIFREKTEHDCNCCKQFVRTAGKIVSIVNNQLVSIWDIHVDNFYQEVANVMSRLVKQHYIENLFRYYTPNIGTDSNKQILEDGDFIQWDHFHFKFEKRYILPEESIPSFCSVKRSSKDVLERALVEIDLSAIEIVYDLIKTNSIYRGEEKKGLINKFMEIKKVYLSISDEKQRDNYIWKIVSEEHESLCKIKNSSIGLLMTDISQGLISLDDAVRKYEKVVAPTNYKRSSAVVTQKMIKDAEKTIRELGLFDAIHRRYAVPEDITVNNLRFVDRSIKPSLNVFDELVDENKGKARKSFSKIDEMSISDFLENVVPKCNSLEMLVENKHSNNLVSLIAPVYPESGNLFKWNNGFSWAYKGDVTDSIKERVKSAGGNIDAEFRCSLSWSNSDDLDLHMEEVNGTHIYFGNKKSRSTGGTLDVDMNAHKISKNPVENICYNKISQMKEGSYRLIVNNYNRRSTDNVGFSIEIEILGHIHTFSYDKMIRDGENIVVAEFNYSKSKGLVISKLLNNHPISNDICGISTENFQKVTMVMDSPNYWDGQAVGNKHVFFILDKCVNPDESRGFFNEFLSEDLLKHRKVLEVLGSKMKAAKTEKQLSGIGFSSTQRNSAIFKTGGGFSRTIKVNF